MKKTKVIIPALGILLLSTAASVTGTVAWFTASNDVEVSGMNFKAQSEEAIVLSNEAKQNWLNSGISATHDGSNATFLSTSTKDFSAWYHAYSSNANAGQATVDRVTFSVTKPAPGTTASNTGLGVVTGATKNEGGASDTSFNGESIYLINRFYIQSATKIALDDQDIYIKDLEVTDETNKNGDLNKALRVGIAFDGGTFVFAPYAGSTDDAYSINGVAGDTVTPIIDTSSGVVISDDDGITIPAYTSDGAGTEGAGAALEMEVYVWFEGEDVNHKSANVKGAMDSLAISFLVGNKAHE